MSDAPNDQEALLRTEGVKRDGKGRLRFRALEQPKSGDSGDDE